MHLGSFKRKDEDTPYTYKEIAQPLVDYAVEKGYNYIEIMPIGEHPCDNSWGYQQTGFYSPTCRYGTPDELRYLINYAHSQKVGVILDFVPVHFAVDGYALADFDGTAIYEYPHKDIWCYSGFTLEELTGKSRASGNTANALLQNIDVLVDGRFEKDKKDIRLKFRGSSNQRIIDVKKSLNENKVIWLDGVWERKMGSGNIYLG